MDKSENVIQYAPQYNSLNAIGTDNKGMSQIVSEIDPNVALPSINIGTGIGSQCHFISSNVSCTHYNITKTRGPKSAAQRAREYRARKKALKAIITDNCITQQTASGGSLNFASSSTINDASINSEFNLNYLNIPNTRINKTKISGKPKSVAERVREYRARKMVFKAVITPKSSAQRAREYRARKKALKLIGTPKTSTQRSQEYRARKKVSVTDNAVPEIDCFLPDVYVDFAMEQSEDVYNATSETEDDRLGFTFVPVDDIKGDMENQEECHEVLVKCETHLVELDDPNWIDLNSESSDIPNAAGEEHLEGHNMMFNNQETDILDKTDNYFIKLEKPDWTDLTDDSEALNNNEEACLEHYEVVKSETMPYGEFVRSDTHSSDISNTDRGKDLVAVNQCLKTEEVNIVKSYVNDGCYLPNRGLINSPGKNVVDPTTILSVEDSKDNTINDSCIDKDNETCFVDVQDPTTYTDNTVSDSLLNFGAESSLTFSKKPCVNKYQFKCKICNRTFIRNSFLNLHILSHTGEKPFNCDLCEKKFTRKENLADHRETHTNKKLYNCDLCGRIFRKESYLATHMMIHSGDMPFICAYCEKKFIRKPDLSRHIVVHTDDKPFQCNLCNKTFGHKSYLARHTKVHQVKK